MALKYDIQNDNFDYYFLEQAVSMVESQKEKLPKELLYKIYRKGYKVKAKGLYAISFLEKLYILTTALNKNWTFIVGDIENVDLEKFNELNVSNDTEAIATEMIDNGIFVLAPNELLETYGKLNNIGVKPVYNYLMKVKTKNYLQPDEHKNNINFLSRFINNYESKRKSILLDAGLSMAEWLTLTFLFDGEEKVCSILYKEKFRFSFNTSSTKIKLSLSTLQNKGFIVKIGQRATSKFKITAIGRQTVSTLLSKYVINC